jgi:alpha-glucosidase (family GH31 glycosyl hydrolase)
MHVGPSSIPSPVSPSTADSLQLSSGYTAGEEDGNRYVFTMNKKRYPDFKGMVAVFHKAGIKVVPNIKPCTCDLSTSPSTSSFASSTSLPRLGLKAS